MPRRPPRARRSARWYRAGPATGGSSPTPGRAHVNGDDDGEHKDSLHEDLNPGGEASKQQYVGDDRDEHGATEGPQGRAASSGNGRAADEDGRDRVECERAAEGDGGRRVERGEEDTRQCDARAEARPGDDRDPADR